MVNNYKRKALVVNIDVLSTRYDRISTVRDIRNNVSGELRKESAPPKILIDGTCLVFYNVPRNKLELVLKKSQRTSIEHGQSFTYVIEEKQLSEEEIIRVLEQDNLNLEQLLSGKDAEMHDLKTGYDELQRNAAEIRKVSDEYKGELKLLKLKDKAPTFQAVRKDECLIVNSYKAVVELVSTYSQNLGVLDENFKPISKLHPEVNLDKLLEIADMGFEKFVM